MNLQGRFVEYQFFGDGAYDESNLCVSNFRNSRYDKTLPVSLVDLYKIGDGEDMCPRNYRLGVATQSWGACLCWENGARRSKWGKSANCVPALPKQNAADKTCATDEVLDLSDADLTEDDWCTVSTMSDFNQVCTVGMSRGVLYDSVVEGFVNPKYCLYGDDKIVFEDLPRGI